jgi:hypothetical protein
MQEIFFEWESPEHHFDKKTVDWYWIVGIISVGASVLSFYFGNILFGLFILIAGFIIAYLSYKETAVVPIKIGAGGILFGRAFHPFDSYKSFWVEDDHMHGPRILLHPISNLLPLTIIPIAEGIDLTELEDFLIDFLNQEPMRESILHKWFDKLLSL